MQIGIVKPISIEEEMRSSYLDYAMSVIVSRALPDVRDGLKPVQRRILYSMSELSLRHTNPFKKSARIVGEVMGKYHPHGDAPIYEALVRLAQSFSMRHTLIEGQGNFGSIDNDPPAAMRYTEARLSEIAQEMLADIDKDTVGFVPNFDSSLKEPTVLPAKLPNLLVNGSAGIAVGMATNIPPQNLGEVCSAVAYLIEHPEATLEELGKIVEGPDFPTGGIILGHDGIRNAYATGQGKIVLRGKLDIEENQRSKRQQVVIREIPYQTNKASLVERIAELARERKIEGIGEVRDESDREGMRVVIELKKEAQQQQVLNNLYKHTSLQSDIFINMLALVDGQPRVLNLREALRSHILFRYEVITRRSRFELQRLRERAHILEGLKIALDNLDQVIAIIRRAENAEVARDALTTNFSLSLTQAQAILDMQLRRLAALERQKLLDEYAEVLKGISYLEDLLASPQKIYLLIKDEALEIRNKYGEPRRTLISGEEAVVFSQEDLVPHQDMVVALSNRGYIKRVPCQSFRLQVRGGRGVTGITTREADGAHLLVVADTHELLLLFTNRGKVYSLKCYQVPGDTSRTSRGVPLVNLLPVDTKEQVTGLVGVKEFGPDAFMILATRRGEVKRVPLAQFSQVRSSGIIAMSLKGGDELVAAVKADNKDEIVLVSEKGMALRLPVKSLRLASRSSGGVKGIRLDPGDRVMGVDVVSQGEYLLVVTANGFGKRTWISSYKLQRRGGKGMLTFRLTSKTGGIAGAKVVHAQEELIIISAEGIVLRTSVEGISVQRRVTQGVILMKLGPGDRVVSLASLGEV